MTPKRWAVAITIGLIGYLALLGVRAVALLRSGEVVPTLLGASLLALPVVGIWALVREWRFGQQIEQMSEELAATGGLPVDDLPRRPSGRVQRDAADAYFAQMSAELELDRSDWRRWFRVADAYDAAGDRKRARAAMRQAVRLREGGSEPAAGAQGSP